MNKIILPLIAIILIAGVGYSFSKLSSQNNPDINSGTMDLEPEQLSDDQSAIMEEKQTEELMTDDQTSEMAQSYTLAEIANHDNKDDCWMAINGKVYDVTNNIDTHPGGEAILEGCGIDATNLFSTRPMGSGTDHPQKAYDYLENLYIGDLAD